MIHTIKNINHKSKNKFSPMESILYEMMNVPINRFITHKDINHTYPATNITELEDKFILQILVPGVSKNEISIDIEHNNLIIARKTMDDSKNTDLASYKLKEFDYQKFERKFTLPIAALKDSIKAKMSKGILEITIDKNPEIKKTITVS